MSSLCRITDKMIADRCTASISGDPERTIALPDPIEDRENVFQGGTIPCREEFAKAPKVLVYKAE